MHISEVNAISTKMTDRDEYNSRGAAKHLRFVININRSRHKKSNKCGGSTMTAEVWADLMLCRGCFSVFFISLRGQHKSSKGTEK